MVHADVGRVRLVPVDDAGILVVVDTPEDFRELLARAVRADR